MLEIYGHHLRTIRILTLIVNKIIIQALKIIRKMVRALV